MTQSERNLAGYLALSLVAACANAGSATSSSSQPADAEPPRQDLDGSFGDAAPNGLCASDTDCDDSNPCTTDTCTSATCSHASVADNTTCGGNPSACMKETCQVGQCAPTPAGTCVRFEACVNLANTVTVTCGSTLGVGVDSQNLSVGTHIDCLAVVSTVSGVSLYNPVTGVFALNGSAYSGTALPAVRIDQIRTFTPQQARGSVSLSQPGVLNLNDGPIDGAALYVVDLCE